MRTGPLQGAPRPWYNGSFDVDFPPRVPFGSADDFNGGLTYSEHVSRDDLRAGVLFSCWTSIGVPFLDLNRVSDLNNCCLRTAYARIVELLYDGDFVKVEEFIRIWLGDAAATFTWIEQGLLPAMAIVRTEFYALMFVTGTTNYQQLSLQAFQGLSGPSNVGGFRSAPIWNQLATVLSERLVEVGVGANLPLVIAGHSFGAAGCACFTIRSLIANPDRKIFRLAWGLPKPTDAAGMGILVRAPYVNVFNEGDVVCQLPLAAYQSRWFPALVGGPLRTLWGEWVESPEYLVTQSNGVKRTGMLPDLSTDVLAPLVVRAVLLQPLAPIEPHTMAEYVRRSCVRCNCPRWPFDAEQWSFLFPVECDAVRLVLTDFRPASGRLLFSPPPKLPDRLVLRGLNPSISRLVFTNNVVTTKSLALEGGLIRPASGRLIFGSPAPSHLVLRSVVPASGRIVLSTARPNCSCCESNDSPSVFSVRINCPGYYWDGEVWQVTLAIISGICRWSGTTMPNVNDTMQFDSDPDVPGQIAFFWLRWDDFIAPLHYDADKIMIPSDWTCSPWFFAITCPLSINGVPTGDDVTFTVESVP